MKTTFTKFLMGAMMVAGTITVNAQTDLVPGINYSYTPPASDNVINDITVDVCNNDNGAAGSFDVAMYLYDQATTNYWIIGTFNVPSLSGSACNTISNWDIDIDNTSGIPAGTYRLGVWVDSNSDVTETDENNNAGLLSGNINYTPATGISNQQPIHFNLTGNFPNPANDESRVSFSLTKPAMILLEVYDLSGKKISEIANDQFPAGQHSIQMNCSKLEAGIYFIRMSSGINSVTRKFSVAH
ncbi:MAG: T9SS type A sorting domain-containing protein [Bacteroidia bacterium]|nr:T9SS type A sorting domain-containing protein [Bacteroidia bacterium]